MATINAPKPVNAFLDLIAASEGTSSHPDSRADGYDVIVSGIDGHHTFTDFATHPFALGRAPILVREAQPEQVKSLPISSDSKPLIVAPAVPALHSTASGRYQLILPTWLSLTKEYGMGTFSPANQDLAAVHILDACHATECILALEIELAIEKACEVWASFPGNIYHQGGRPIQWLLTHWQMYLGAQNA